MRTQNWESRLAEYLQSVRHTPFRWGQHDCALFTAGAVAAITGRDLAEHVRGKYGTAHEAQIFMPNGIESLPEEAGLKQVDVAFAKRGDVALVKNGDKTVLGVVDLTGRYVACPGMRGLLLVPRNSALRAWTVE